MGKLLVFGSINMDLVIYVADIPALGETVTGGSFQSFPGGKGANQAVAAAKAGARVAMYGCVGDDSLGQECISNLEKAGIDVSGVIIKKGTRTGIAQIMVEATGENIIAVAPGANFLFDSAEVVIPEEPEEKQLIALFQNEIPQRTTEAIIQGCSRRGIMVLWNTAPACQQRPSAKTIDSVTYLICNRVELRSLVGEGNDDTLALKLRDWGVQNVIVTMGEQGALLVTKEEVWYQPAFQVTPVDTVGAGDCFCGVFACALSLGISAKQALRRASVAAALSVTMKGTQTSMPTAGQIDKFLLSYL
jgi:ribokinase